MLSLRLALADRPVRYDPKTDRYLHAEGPAGDQGAIRSGALLWQTHEGGRKARRRAAAPDRFRFLQSTRVSTASCDTATAR